MSVNRRGFLSLLVVAPVALSTQTWQRSEDPYEDPIARLARILDEKNVSENKRFVYISGPEWRETNDE